MTPEEQREKNRIKMAKWRAENPERARQAGRESKARERAKDPEAAREKQRKWRTENLEYARERERQYNARMEIIRPEYMEKRRGNNNKWQRENPEIVRAYHRKWDAANPDRIKHYHLKYHYGLSLKEYQAMLEQQQGCCAACLEPFQEDEKPYVDHCHTTKVVRGLIHMMCNTGLGHSGDSPEKLRRWADYLERRIKSEEATGQ